MSGQWSCATLEMGVAHINQDLDAFSSQELLAYQEKVAKQIAAPRLAFVELVG